jgi:hypothetical protein
LRRTRIGFGVKLDAVETAVAQADAVAVFRDVVQAGEILCKRRPDFWVKLQLDNGHNFPTIAYHDVGKDPSYHSFVRVGDAWLDEHPPPGADLAI